MQITITRRAYWFFTKSENVQFEFKSAVAKREKVTANAVSAPLRVFSVTISRRQRAKHTLDSLSGIVINEDTFTDLERRSAKLSAKA